MQTEPVDARPQGSVGAVAAVWIWAALAFAVATMLYALGRWWLPPVASQQGEGIDGLFRAILTVVTLVFVGVQGLLGLALWRFRDRGQGRAAHWHDNPRLELTWTAATALILAGFTIFGGTLWVRVHGAPPPGALTVEVTGEQFGWVYRYPGPDGVFGRTNPRLISGRNPLGLDTSDPAAADDRVTRELRLPVNQPVLLRIRAKDVIHSFFIPAMRFKQDAVPGRVIERWITPTRTGRFTVACAELCGVGHYVMASAVVVETPEAFQRWLQAGTPGVTTAMR